MHTTVLSFDVDDAAELLPLLSSSRVLRLVPVDVRRGPRGPLEMGQPLPPPPAITFDNLTVLEANLVSRDAE